MSRQRGEGVDQAVRPDDLGDVEERGAGEEEERGEEPGEVDVHDQQGRGVRREER